ncbi:MAG: arginine--tRNA ligase [Victivallales bacterium]|nr:arginine--tRNA ligase [Victivallales bacterium]
MNFKCVSDLSSFLQQQYPAVSFPAAWQVVGDKCPGNMSGDLTINCFRFARLFRQAPDAMAREVAAFLAGHDDVETAEAVKAFVNITLRPGAVHRDTVADPNRILGATIVPAARRRRILIEYSAPNTNKPQHLGHVRNNTLGMSLAALLQRVGHEVIPINLVNDRGIHICKSMIAYQRFGEGETPASSGIKGDHLVGKYYVRFNTELKRQLDALTQARPELADRSDEDLFLETELGAATQKMLQDWEAGVPVVRELWQLMNSWVFAGFAQTYARMGVKFAHTYLESETYLLGKDNILDGLARGVFSRRDDGAIIADLGKLGQKVVLRSDGTSVYITQDIGTTIRKYNDYHPDTQIWVVGDEQIHHFKMLFEILRRMGFSWADNLYHLAYGMVNLPSGKMKSREGTVVDADDLFAEMAALARAATLERCGDEIPADLDERAEIIGMGALKFMLLKFNPKTTMMFDPQASLKFEGDTGPYVQYAGARINSIAAKAAEKGLVISDDVNWELLAAPEEKALSIMASFYPATLAEAAEKMDCSVLVGYLLDLAKAFNRFYRECPVLSAEDDALRQARMQLCFRIRDLLTDGLNTLTIGVPAAM